MRKILFTVVILAGLGAAAFWFWNRRGAAEVGYRFVEIERGDLEAVVASTGTLEPVTLVAVGTQVSGLIAEVLVDYNDQVEEGQVLARLDTSVLATNLEDARSSERRARAELALAEADYTRINNLTQQELLPPSELDQAQRSLAVSRANLESARSAIERATRNLGFATIVAPISGTVVSRSIDAGQTVAASLSAPELFRIAADLSSMQILAAVDESDIGSIEPGQAARFTVQAHPDTRFAGTVRQVRLQPTMSDNVVSYTVVVDVNNPGEALLPGMTATVEFLVAQVSDVLKVSNAALRFRPPEALMSEMMARRRRERGEGPPSGDQRAESRARPPEVGEGAGRPTPGTTQGGSAPGPGPAGPSGGGNGASRQRLFVVDENGELAMIPVRTGLSDGANTEVSGPGLEEGRAVVVGITSGPAANASPSSNPFQQGQSQPTRGPRVPGGF